MKIFKTTLFLLLLVSLFDTVVVSVLHIGVSGVFVSVFTRIALLLKEDSEFCDWDVTESEPSLEVVERSSEMVAGVESERVERRTKSHDMMKNNVVVVKKNHKDFLETTLMAEAFLSAIVIASQLYHFVIWNIIKTIRIFVCYPICFWSHVPDVQSSASFKKDNRCPVMNMRNVDHGVHWKVREKELKKKMDNEELKCVRLFGNWRGRRRKRENRVEWGNVLFYSLNGFESNINR